MTAPIKSPKKLIEVALPLDAINVASAREKSIRHGHPSTLHLWWARRPLAAARAVIFAQMVNDPGGERGYFAGMTKAQAAAKREELFKIIEDLVQWENTNNEAVLERARAAIRESWVETCRLNKGHPQAAELFNPDRPPAFHDPFAGGGALPLEAQRLGLESWASDLNPVAVTINKAMIEIPPVFAGRPPVGPVLPSDQQTRFGEDWRGSSGLAQDVCRYGLWLRDAVAEKIGHLYPPIRIPDNLAIIRPELKPLTGQELTVIAWLWVRTVQSPSPAHAHIKVPLSSTFVLSKKPGNECYLAPKVSADGYELELVHGLWPESSELGTSAGKRKGFVCIASGAPIPYEYIREEGRQGRLGSRLVCVVAEGIRGRVFLPPNRDQENSARLMSPDWKPEVLMPEKHRNFQPPAYGMMSFGDIFSDRQLVALNAFSDSLSDLTLKVEQDALLAGFSSDRIPLDEGGRGALAYAQAVSVYMACAIDKAADYWSTLCFWHNGAAHLKIVNTFGRQALPMTWDYAEANPFSTSSGHFLRFVSLISEVIDSPLQANAGIVLQADASSQCISAGKVVSTDPPYYDNIAYADLSDFFYPRLRRSLKSVYPSLFATVAVPKSEELVASPTRHGGKSAAEQFFLTGMKRAIHAIATQSHPAFPISIYYAFKQSETTESTGTTNTGWETFLEAVLESGLAIGGTWPVRTEYTGNLKGGFNALASSIVLVCRRREPDAPKVGRRAFIRELNDSLPSALDEMTRGGVNSPVAPVDLSQAIIGPGMAIFSQYSAVLEADGSKMSVKTALQLINRFLAEDDFDHDTQFCLAWFEQQGWATGKFGEGDVLARAKGTSVSGLADAGVLESSGGNLRLLRWAELDAGWSPEDDARTPVWEALHQLIRALNKDGESAAGALLARMPARAEPMRALAYRLYTLCERQGWAEDARAYNELVAAWSSIEATAAESGPVGEQVQLDY
jgi:putative DNA methylase